MDDMFESTLSKEDWEQLMNALDVANAQVNENLMKLLKMKSVLDRVDN